MHWLLQVVIGALAGAGAIGLARMLFRYFKGPITHLGEQIPGWSSDEIQLIAGYGYGDLSRIIWVIDYEVDQRKTQGYKIVRIGRLPLFKRECHLPRKGVGRFALLMQKPRPYQRN